jgi:hypothetical protein
MYHEYGSNKSNLVHNPPALEDANGSDVPSDNSAIHGDNSEPNVATPSSQPGVEQSILDVVKQLRELNTVPIAYELKRNCEYDIKQSSKKNILNISKLF